MSFLEDIRPSVIERAEALLPEDRVSHHGPSLVKSIRGRETLSIIAEVKRRSPTRGVLSKTCDAPTQAALYSSNGATAVSVLTEPTRFGGCIDDIRDVRPATSLPIIMKDFILDRRQIDAGCRAGADGFLLIAAFLSPEELARLVIHGKALGMDSVCECRSTEEIQSSVDAGAEIIGINNRSMNTLDVDTSRALQLANDIPDNIVAIAESGYRQPSQLKQLIGQFDAVLIGSALMSTNDPSETLRGFVSCT